MQAQFTFKPLSPEDFPLLLSWLAQPHVKAWWDDGDDTLDKVALHFGDMCGQSPEEQGFLACYQETPEATAVPIGYIQYYLLPDGGAGLDVFLGEAAFLNRGIGTRLIQAFLERLLAWHNPAYFVIDPEPENTRAIRCYEKVGFRHYETIRTEEGKRAYMMRLNQRGKATEE